MSGPGEMETIIGEMGEGPSGAALAPKKSRGKKSLLDRGPTALPKNRGTGFEEYYAEPPITPGEHLEEKHQIYAHYLPFHERIESCIQRFRARRRMDNDTNMLFSKYLMLGGMDAQQRQFTGATGIDPAQLLDATTEEKRGWAANDVIDRNSTESRWYHPGDSEHWDIDFEGVAAGFFSGVLCQESGSDIDVVNKGVQLVLNFLNYVLLHDVCPEYVDNINAARRVCERAFDELPRCFRATALLPGAFNLAAGELYCRPEDDRYSFDSAFTHMIAGVDADAVFCAGITFGPEGESHADRLYQAYLDAMKGSGVYVTATTSEDLEVVRVVTAHAAKRRLFAGVKSRTSGAKGNVEPIGVVYLRPCVILDGWDTREPDEVGPGEANCGAGEPFLLDDKLLRELLPGMKLRAEVCSLNIGLRFFRSVIQVCPSFYVFLPQELMLSYREPAPNERPAPSTEDPDADDRAMGRIFSDETDQGKKVAVSATKKRVVDLDF